MAFLYSKPIQFIMLSMFLICATMHISPAKAQSGKALSKQLNSICIQNPDGFTCLKTLKSGTRNFIQSHIKQFQAAGSVTIRDPQYANDANLFLKEYCGPVIGEKTYDLRTQQQRKAVVLKVTGDINRCLRSIRASKEEDSSGRVKVDEQTFLSLYYYNTCLRGLLDQSANQECKALAKSANLR